MKVKTFTNVKRGAIAFAANT